MLRGTRQRLLVLSRAYGGGHADHHKPAAASGPVHAPKAGEMPTDEEQATGLERRELEAKWKGEKLFGEDVLYGAMGTPENPVIVRSVFDTRIVGCVGHEGLEHELTWHVVSNGRPLVCVHCAQVFQLEKFDDPYLHAHHH